MGGIQVEKSRTFRAVEKLDIGVTEMRTIFKLPRMDAASD